MNLQYLREKLGRPRFLDSTKEWDSEAQRRFWNDENGRYLQPDTIGEEAIRRGRKVLELVAALRLPAHSRILEVGCANGWFSEWLATMDNVHGIDISDESIEEAKRRVPRAEFEVGDILSATLPDDSDLAVNLETISHVADQRRFIEVIADALRPGGYLIIATQNRPIYARRSNIRLPAEGQYRHWLNREGLVRILKPNLRPVKVLTIEPNGDLGFMRIVNSRKLNSMLERFFSKKTITSLKETFGFGQTLIVVAEKA